MPRNTRSNKREKRKDRQYNDTQFNNLQEVREVTNIKIIPKTDAQKKYLNNIIGNDLIFCTGSAGTGKSYIATSYACKLLAEKKINQIILTRPAITVGEELGFLKGPQPLDARIYTPSGYTTMGELNVGDYVIGADGKPAKILNIYKKGVKEVFKITTSDGTTTEACGDHIWLASTAATRKRLYDTLKNTPEKAYSLKSTNDIKNNLYTKHGKINFHLPRNKAVAFEKKQLPLHPYILGCLIGDGSFISNVSFHNPDIEIVNRLKELLLPYGCFLTQYGDISYTVTNAIYSNKVARPVKITNLITNKTEVYATISEACVSLNLGKGCLNPRCSSRKIVNNVQYEFLDKPADSTNIIKNILIQLGMFGSKAVDKYVPDLYMYSSIEDRLELLRGLMDTDGTISEQGGAAFCTVSKKLADCVVELVKSLGGRAVLASRDRVGKVSRFNGRNITSNHIAYEFSISMPNEYNPFFLPRKANRFKDGYMHGVGIVSIESVGEKEVQCLLVDNESHLYLTDNYIVTHNTLEEKYTPYLEPFLATFYKHFGRSYTEYLFKTEQIVAKPLGFLLGVTFEDAFVIFDEAEDATCEQMKLFLTRIGENCKVVIDGDLEQQSTTHFSGMKDAINLLQHIDNVGFFNFTIDDCIRSKLTKEILIAYSNKHKRGI